jgi:hypothetical protein
MVRATRAMATHADDLGLEGGLGQTAGEGGVVGR